MQHQQETVRLRDRQVGRLRALEDAVDIGGDLLDATAMQEAFFAAGGSSGLAAGLLNLIPFVGPFVGGALGSLIPIPGLTLQIEETASGPVERYVPPADD